MAVVPCGSLANRRDILQNEGQRLHAGSRPHYNLTFGILALAGIAYALLQSLIIPALHQIQLDLGASTTGATWVLTSFLISACVAIPILGRLGDMFGKKRILVVVLLAVVVGSAVSALASSLGLLIVGRVIQGLGGAVYPLAFGIIRDEFPRERVATGIAMISAMLGFGGGLGIVLSGPIIENLSFHWLFWVPLIVAAVAAVAAVFVIPESPVRSPGRVDWVGAVLLSGWLVALLLGISESSSWGWGSVQVISLFAAAAVLGVIWAFFEARKREPLVDMQMMRLRGVWTVNTCSLLIGFSLFGGWVLISQLVQVPASTGYGFGASVTQAGLYLLPGTLGMLFFSAVAGRLSSTVGSKVPLALGTLVSTVAFVQLAVAHTQSWQIYLGMMLMGIGIGLAFSAMANLIVEAVPPEQTGVATGMHTITRTIGNAFGSQASAAIIAGSIAATGLPQESGFTIAFAVFGGALLFCFLVIPFIPPRRIQVLASTPALAQAD